MMRVITVSASDSAASTTGANATREFVAGEKFFVTKIDTRSDSVTLYFISDPIKDVRYHAMLKFPFAKGTAPSPDDVAGLVSEVVKVDDTSQDQQSAANQNGQQGAAAPAEPKTIGAIPSAARRAATAAHRSAGQRLPGRCGELPGTSSAIRGGNPKRPISAVFHDRSAGPCSVTPA